MEHKFETLTTVLNRCSAKVADQVIAEIRAAITDAQQGNDQPATDLAEMETAVHTTKAEQAAARRTKAAARRAAKKAAKEAAHNEYCGVASRLAAGSAEAELPAQTSTPSEEGCAEAFTAKMVKYLRQCPERYMLSVLNSYFHLIFTGNLVNTDDDHRFIDNFIYLARLEGLIDHAQKPTAAQAAAFLFDNPALPLPRAERRRLQRLARKTNFLKSA